jgi:3-oxoacyl-[acyl-carrier protein] reductase
VSTSTEHRPLQGKVALVTGASRGIGKAIALRLSERGAKVACVATEADKARETAEQCSQRTEGAQAYGCEVGDTKKVAELVEQVQKELGGLDILVNNAGITRDQLLMRMSEEDFDRVLDVNLKGAWNFLKAASRPLMKSKGRVINITSVVGLTGNAGQANYAASKAGLVGLSKSVAKELAGRGVCVNAVAPGFVTTDMTAALDEPTRNKLLQSIPLGRLGSPDDIAAAVEFLAGPGGAYITGHTLVVDGGMSV